MNPTRPPICGQPDDQVPRACLGCGDIKPVCSSCRICSDCWHTDRIHGTRVATGCIICDDGQSDLTQLPWHTGGRAPLTLAGRVQR